MTKWLRDWFEAIVQFMFVLIICSCAVGGFLLGKSQELDDFGSEIAMGLLCLAIGCIIGFIIAFFVCGFLATIIKISNDIEEIKSAINTEQLISRIKNIQTEDIIPEEFELFADTDSDIDSYGPPPKATNINDEQKTKKSY